MDDAKPAGGASAEEGGKNQGASKKKPQESGTKRVLLGLYLLGSAVALVWAVFALWPVEIDPPDCCTWDHRVYVFGKELALHDEARLLLLVILVGALGSYVHAATSFASYVGNETLRYSWMWWYILRPFIGMALALIFYFVLRGGLLASATQAEDMSLFGIAAVAGLVGMFSKQATDKLNELFKSLFQTSRGEGDDARKNKLHASDPVHTAMVQYDKIEKLVLDRAEDQVKLVELIEKLGPTVTRIPILDPDRRARYVIHEGLLCKYFARKALEAGFDKGTHTLRQFLDAPNHRPLVEALAFVGAEATLSEAKQAMDEVENCRDVFVTKDGTKDGEVVGWLTNVDIDRQLRG